VPGVTPVTGIEHVKGKLVVWPLEAKIFV
jgi:hypothetical protein